MTRLWSLAQCEYAKECLRWSVAVLTLPVAMSASAADARAGAPVGHAQPEAVMSRVPGEVLVRFTHDSSTGERRDSLTAAGSDAVDPIEGIPRARRLELEPGQTVAEALGQLRSRGDVAWATPNLIGHVSAIPDDPGFDQLWADQNTGQDVISTSGTPGADISAPAAWDTAIGSLSTRVAVVDTGIDPANPDIAPNFDAGLSRNFTASPTTGIKAASNWVDANGHGTHVAGTIAAAGDNGIGITGVNWKAKLVAVRACGFDGSCDTASVASALAYAGQIGARAVNVSLEFAGSAQSSSAMRSAMAANPKTLYVVAAGNDGNDNEQSPNYPCDFDLDNSICVAATDQNDQLADFSDYGRTFVDLGAPGVNVLSTVPNIVDHLDPTLPDGLNGWTQSPASSWVITPTPGGGKAITYQGSGTSSVISPALDFSAGDRCSLHYLLKAKFHSGQSFLAEASTDHGATWQSPPYSTIDSGSGFDENSFTSIDEWLGDIASGHLQVELRFRVQSSQAMQPDPSIEIAFPSATCIDPQPPGGSYDYYSGTSMATPQVTGAATGP